MSKLASKDQFLDLSDYGRPLGKRFATYLKNTRFTAIHVTLLFGIVGLLGGYCILRQYYILAGVLIILKSIIDAADGELARLKNCPSYFGRYLDSLFDIALNFMFLMAIGYTGHNGFFLSFAAFFCMQLQGTLYNYYYVILRTKSVGGDATSKIFEYKAPKALPGETQKSVNLLFSIYYILYGGFDILIHLLDRNAYKVKTFPNWFMTMLSIYGLGFQLLLMAIMLPLHLVAWIIPLFIANTLFMVVLIIVRKTMLKH